MGFHDGGFQHDKAEVFVDADIHLHEAFHDGLVFADPCGDEFYQIVVPTRNEMAFDDGIDLLDRREKAREIDLPMILQSDFGENGQGLPELGDVDLGGIAGDAAS